MQFKAFAEKNRADLPPLMQNGDTFVAIQSFTIKSIDYQGKPTDVGLATTDKGIYGTFSGVIIKTLKEYFDKNTEPLENVRVVAPRGKKYLALESSV